MQFIGEVLNKKYLKNQKIVQAFLKKKIEDEFGIIVKKVIIKKNVVEIFVKNKADEIKLFQKKNIILNFVNFYASNFGFEKLNLVYVKTDFSAFSLLETIIVVGILSILLFVILNIFLFLIRQKRIGELNFVLNTNAVNFLTWFNGIENYYKIDLNEYGRRRFLGCDSADTTGDFFVWDVNENGNGYCDIWTKYGNEDINFEKKIGDYKYVKELYFLSKTGDEKLILRQKIKTGVDSDKNGIITLNEREVVLQKLYLKGFDLGTGHSLEQLSSGSFDGIYDSWFCDYKKGSLCHGNPLNLTIYSGYFLPVDGNDGFVDLNMNGLTLSNWNIEFLTGVGTGYFKVDFEILFYIPYWKVNYPPSMLKNLSFPIELFINY